MKNRIVFLVAIMIMVSALLSMGISWLIFAMPDWTVRIIGIVIMVDLIILTYLFIRIKHKHIV